MIHNEKEAENGSKWRGLKIAPTMGESHLICAYDYTPSKPLDKMKYYFSCEYFGEECTHLIATPVSDTGCLATVGLRVLRTG